MFLNKYNTRSFGYVDSTYKDIWSNLKSNKNAPML